MSGDRKGAYMRPGARASAPGVVFTIEIETVNRQLGGKTLTVAKRFARAVVTRSVYRRGKWDAPKIGHCDTIEGVREWMAKHSIPGRTNWVVPTDASQALTLLQWWGYAEQCGITQVSRSRGQESDRYAKPRVGTICLENLCVRTGTTIVTFHQDGTRWRWVNASQFDPSGQGYAVQPDDSVGTEGSDRRGDGPGHRASAEARALAVSAWFRGLCTFWRERAKSCFGTTVGQLAIGMLRSHIAKKALCSHSLDDAHMLERAAAFGGRASSWYVGDIGRGSGIADADAGSGTDWPRARIEGPVTHIDVRSMYPTLLRDMTYPTKIKNVYGSMPVKDALDLSRDFCTIARVTIQTDVPEYPRRTGDRVDYPTGRFLTTLTGPELVKLASEGEIQAVHELAWYNSGTPFKDAAGAMLDIRADAQRRGHKSDESFSKLLANSLGGKLAQRSGGWVRWQEEDSPGTWGEEWRYDMRTDERQRCRYLAGMCWKWQDDKTGKGPYTFAFAYLAAYGRLMMRSIREHCPTRSVVSQDTDGLWVLQPALDALAALNEPQGDGPGSLRVTARAADARFWGPRHYVAGGKWVLAGFTASGPQDDGVTIRDAFDSSVWAQKAGTAPTETMRCVRESKLKLQDVGGDVSPDGWVVPRVAGGSRGPAGPR